MCWGFCSLDVKTLWDQTCSVLKNKINELSYNTWISPMTPELVDKSCLYLLSPTSYLADFFNKKYSSQVLKIARELDHNINAVIAKTEQEMDTVKLQTSKSKFTSSDINSKYTFENFVVGNNNRFVYTVALAVSESPAEVYNPLFIYGGTGLGKTHLLHAIGNYINELYPNLKVKYVTGEAFMNELITSMGAKDDNRVFRNNYRNLDVLMVDDIQFIAGKMATQEEFFHTFNALHNMGKQIILTSDKPPADIEKLEERLISRFTWGLIADIQKPDIETRIAILKKKAELDNLEVNDEVLAYIAEKIDSNIRELEGALIKLKAFASLKNRPIDMAMVQDALRDTKTKKHEVQASCDRIVETVSSFYGVAVEDLKGKKRTKEIATARQITMFLMRDLLSMSFPMIGKSCGNKDHSTVIHAYNKINEAMKNSDMLSSQIADLIKLIDLN